MNNERYVELVKSILAEVLNRIDFKNGIIQEVDREKREKGYILDVRWKRNVHFILHISRWDGCSWYYVERSGEQVSHSYLSIKNDDKFFRSVQHLVNEIENGDFDFKKTMNGRLAEIISERQLTSYMNETKWKEFIHAMNEEMLISIPYDYKTLFEEDIKVELIGICSYDRESFNDYYFKSIEWVKIKPKFYESIHRGMLIEDEKIYHDMEQEFIDLMKKYSIRYEYDEENEFYIIYGYK